VKSKHAEFLVIGLGRFGSSLAMRLTELGHTVVAVDSDARVTQELANSLPNLVTADATDEPTLAALGVEEFTTAIVAIGDDFESSVLVTASLKQRGVPRVVAKAMNSRQRAVLLRIGADQVALPEHEAGVRMANVLATGAALVDRMELGAGVSVSELRCPAALVGRSLGESNLRARYGVTVLAIRGARLVTHPTAAEVLQSEDLLIVLGSDQDVGRLASL